MSTEIAVQPQKETNWKTISVVFLVIILCLIAVIIMQISFRKNNDCDDLEAQAINYNKQLLKKYDSAIQNYKKLHPELAKENNNNSYTSNLFIYQSMQMDFAKDYLKEFRGRSSSTTVNTAMQQDGLFSLLIGKGDENQSSDFSNFAALFKRHEINGIRIYLSRYNRNNADPNQRARSHSYSLIVVGTLNGVDQFRPTNDGTMLTIQNYGQPCKPPYTNCMNSSNQRIDQLGKQADDLTY